MENLDALRTQVDELKECLGTSDARQESEASEFKTLLASIKTNLQTKQAEIDRLVAENEQLRRMLDDALAAAQEYQVQSNGNVLRDLHAEMAALVEPIGVAGPEETPDEGRAEPESRSGPDRPSEAEQDQPEPAAELETDAQVDDSPALRRIMHRGRGAK